MVRRLITAVVALLAAMAAYAQNYKISLQLQDAVTGEAVGFATASANPEKGQGKYTLSDGAGHAVIEKVKAGKYILRAELMGYKTYEQSVEV